MTVTEIAQVVHEIQQAFCESLGDNSLPGWYEAGEMQRNTINGVEFLLFNPEAGHGASHEAWREDKIESGWTYGPVKDWDKKQHPSLVPFYVLPLIEQQKDVLFVQTVRSLEKFLNK